ncbi:putative DNA repair protein RAD51 [Cardamine amara subsp. amara]|uniref:DNA repair protein RAD51 n=1 Tax=Cardamine amara subsp. amara TaxID=228776 RepID=A0ABD1A553_CARAN
MAPLKHLEKENPIIDASFRDFCASHGILTVEDFLVHDLYELAAFAQRHTNADRLKEGITLMLSFIELQCRPWLNGMELLDEMQRNKHILSTGDKGTDSLLQGGFREGQLTELVGPSSSGKTQFCLQAAASVAENHLGRVLYLDTGNSFSARRIAQFICSSSDPALGQKVMIRISCHAVYDIYTMFETLQGLEVTLRSQVRRNVNEDRLRLLVVDSVSSLITPILGGSGSQGRALMVAVGYLLKKLAHEHSIAILVTNHTVGAGGEGGKTKPALGETWKSIPHVRLMLSRDHKNSNCNISILKHTFMPSGQAVRTMTRKDNQQCI